MRRRVMVLALPGLLALAACGHSSRTSTSTGSPSTPSTEAPTQPAGSSTAAATVKASPSSLGMILVDATTGTTLYVFDHDSTGTSNCNGGCASAWPPLMAPAQGPPSGVSGLGVMTKSDGAKQVTYNGKPLYHYSGDTQPGQTNGNGFGGIWHVVLLSSSPAPAPSTTKAGGAYGY